MSADPDDNPKPGTLSSQPTLERAAHEGDSTTAIQELIDQLANHGGGRLILGPGVHQISSITLRSGVHLVLDEGCVLHGMHQELPHVTLSIAEESHTAMIYARGAHDIGIEGPGVIDGAGTTYFTAADAHGYVHHDKYRPRVVVFEGCDRVQLSGFRIQDSPMWTIHLVGCRDCTLHGLQLRSDLRFPNTDGIDIDACRGVRVIDCDIHGADDSICLKTTLEGTRIRQRIADDAVKALAYSFERPSSDLSTSTPADDGPQSPDAEGKLATGEGSLFSGKSPDQPLVCEDIEVRRCTLQSHSCALKIGTETHSAVRRVSFVDCRVIASNRAFGIQSRDGGKITQIQVLNLRVETILQGPTFWGSAEPVHISARSRDPEIAPGVVHDVQISGLSGECQGPIIVVAEEPGMIGRVVFDDVRLCLSDHPEAPMYAMVDLRPPVNPDSTTGFGMDNAYRMNPETGRPWGVEPMPGGLTGVYLRHCDDVELNGVNISRDNSCLDTTERS